MNKPGARMCKACKEARKSVDFSQPLDIPKARRNTQQKEQMVACPKCGTLWQASRPGKRAPLRV